MYIKSSGNTKSLVLRSINGRELEAPITVLFAKTGVARVKEGVGELLCDMFPSVSIYDNEQEVSTETEEE